MVEITNLHLSYGSKDTRSVLNGIDLQIRQGETIGLMGMNGSGKTTLARCLNGLLIPTKGDVVIARMNTRDKTHLPQIRRHVGMVFQNPENQIVSTTVEREIAFGLENLGMPYEKMHETVNKILIKFDLAKYRTYPPHRLSGGEMQRLAIASVIAMSPRVVIFDEPTSQLDAINHAMVMAIIKNINLKKTENPTSILLITQKPEDVLFCDRLVVLHEGRVRFDKKPNDVFAHVDTLFDFGLPVPAEFEVYHRLKQLRQSGIPFTPEEFHTFCKDAAAKQAKR